MASVFSRSTRSESLGFSSGFIRARSTPVPGLDWPSVSALQNAIAGESGWNPNQAWGQPSFSPSRPDCEETQQLHVLVVEDNRADVFLVREAIARYHLKVELHVVENGKAAFDFIDMADADPSAPCPCLAMLDLNVPIRDGKRRLTPRLVR